MPTINDRIGSQNIIRVLSNASAPPTRVNNLIDVVSTKKDETTADGYLLIWDRTTQKYNLGNDIPGGLNVQGISTFNSHVDFGEVNFSGVTTAPTFAATEAIAMGATTVITAARQLQNIASLDATTTATIEAAVTNAPNTFTDLQITGLSTFLGPSRFDGVATFNNGIHAPTGVATIASLNIADEISISQGGLDVTGHTELDNLNVSGVSTFAGAVDINNNVDISGYIDVDGQTTLDDLNVSGVSTFAGLVDGNAGANFSGAETTLSSATVSDLTDNRVVIAGASGALEDSGNLTFNGSKLTVTGNAQVTTDLDVDGGADISGGVGLNVVGHTELDNLNVSGVSTFVGVSTFSGDVYVGGDLYLKDDLVLDNITGSSLKISGLSTFTGDAQFDGNVSIAGTLTYEDVTNVDSVGIVTAGKGVRVTTGGIVVTAGVSTFSDLVDINAGGRANTFQVENLTLGRVVFTAAGGTLVDSSNLTFDGTTLTGTYFANFLQATELRVSNLFNVSGISTFNAGLEVVGHSELDYVNVSAAATVVGTLTAGLIDGGSY